MTSALATIVLSLGLVLGFAQAAQAQDGYVQPPFVCGPTQEPSQVPCDQVPTTPPTTNPIKYCLGYAQGFPSNQPCPRPPVDVCAVPVPPLECHPDYKMPPPVVDAGKEQVAPDRAVVTEPSVAATVPAEVSPTPVVLKTQHKATQRVSAAPARLPATGSSSTIVIVAGIGALLVGALLLFAGRRGTVG